MAFPTGWSSQILTIDNTKVSGTVNLTDFPVLITEASLGTGAIGTAIFGNTQDQEISGNYLSSDSALRGYWRLEDTSDGGTNTYTLTNVGTCQFVSGKFSNCVDIESGGSAQYLYRSNATSANLKFTSSFSGSCWVNMESDINSTVVSMDNGDASGGWFLGIYAKQMQFGFRNGSSSPNIYHSLVLELGKWYHVGFSFDSTANTLTLSVNGQVEVATGVTTDPAATTADFCIGGRKPTGGFGEKYDGKIDDLALWGRALSTTELLSIWSGGADLRFTSDSGGSTALSHETITWDTVNKKAEVWVKLGTVNATTDTSFYLWYNNGTAQSTQNGTAVWSNGYQGVWHLEGSYKDSSYNSYHMANGTAPAYIGTAKIGGGYDFEADSNQFITIADASCANLEIGGAQTWESWVKPESLDAAESDGYPCIARKQSGAAYHGILLGPATEGAYFQLTGLSTNTSVVSGTYNPVGNWINVCGVYDSSASKLRVFINGTKTEVTASGTANDTNGAFSIGRAGGENSLYFDGVQDELRVSNASRSDDWIITSYNNQNDPATFIVTQVNYTRAISDSLTITDTRSRLATYSRTVAQNSVNLTDVRSRTASRSIKLSDSLTITDSIYDITTQNIVISDILGITDTYNRVVSYIRNQTNTVNLTDVLSRNLGFNRTISDNVGLTDTIFSTLATIRSLSDSIGLTDELTYRKLIAVMITDVISITDTRSRLVSYIRSKTDNVGITDQNTRFIPYSRDITDSVNLTDTLKGISFIDNIRFLENDVNITDLISYTLTSPNVFHPIIEFYQIDEVVPTIEDLIDGTSPTIYDLING